MSLLWIDGFDSYGYTTGSAPAPAGILGKYYTVYEPEATYFDIEEGRVSGYALELSFQSVVHFRTRHLGNSSTYSIIVGFGYKIVGAVDTVVQTIVSACDQNGAENCHLKLEPDATLAIYRGTTQLAKSTVPFTPTDWNYIEWRVEIADSATSSVRINGTEVLSATGIDTKSSTAATRVEQLGFYNYDGSSGMTHLDDLYVLNMDSTGASDFLGPCIVETIRPSGDAGTNNWTPNSGAVHYDRVNNLLLDNDTTYLSTDTADAYDMWNYQDITSTPSTIYGLAVKTEAREDQGGSTQIASVIDSNGTIEDGDSETISIAGYLPIVQVSEIDPDTTTAWTASSVIAAKFGIKKI